MHRNPSNGSIGEYVVGLKMIELAHIETLVHVLEDDLAQDMLLGKGEIYRKRFIWDS